MSHSLKVLYTSRISYRVPNLVFFLVEGGRGGEAYLKRGAYSKFKALGTYSKQDAYLKLDTNSSIDGAYRRKVFIYWRLKTINACTVEPLSEVLRFSVDFCSLYGVHLYYI